MRKQTRLQLKVGLFINIGLVLFVVAVLALGKAQNVFSANNSYDVMIPSASGLLKGANVHLAGVQVGTVSGFELRVGDPPVRMKLKIAKQYGELIREGTVATITATGLVGERIVELTAGNPAKPGISPGKTIPYKSGADLDEMVVQGEQLLDNLTDLSTKLNRSLAGDRLGKTLDQVDEILAKINRGSGTLSGFLNDPELYDTAKSLVGQANENRIVRNLVRKATEDAEKQRARAGRNDESR